LALGRSLFLTNLGIKLLSVLGVAVEDLEGRRTLLSMLSSSETLRMALEMPWLPLPSSLGLTILGWWRSVSGLVSLLAVHSSRSALNNLRNSSRLSPGATSKPVVSSSAES
jgi:hypothetical protein